MNMRVLLLLLVAAAAIRGESDIDFLLRMTKARKESAKAPVKTTETPAKTTVSTTKRPSTTTTTTTPAPTVVAPSCPACPPCPDSTLINYLETPDFIQGIKPVPECPKCNRTVIKSAPSWCKTNQIELKRFQMANSLPALKRLYPGVIDLWEERFYKDRKNLSSQHEDCETTLKRCTSDSAEKMQKDQEKLEKQHRQCLDRCNATLGDKDEVIEALRDSIVKGVTACEQAAETALVAHSQQLKDQEAEIRRQHESYVKTLNSSHAQELQELRLKESLAEKAHLEDLRQTRERLAQVTAQLNQSWSEQYQHCQVDREALGGRLAVELKNIASECYIKVSGCLEAMPSSEQASGTQRVAHLTGCFIPAKMTHLDLGGLERYGASRVVEEVAAVFEQGLQGNLTHREWYDAISARLELQEVEFMRRKASDWALLVAVCTLSVSFLTSCCIISCRCCLQGRPKAMPSPNRGAPQETSTRRWIPTFTRPRVAPASAEVTEETSVEPEQA